MSDYPRLISNKLHSFRNFEFKVHEKGIYKLFGISPYKSLFPIARYILRLLPSSIIRMLYNGKIRRKLTM